MDEKGRLFGKVNIIDFLVVSSVIIIVITIVTFGFSNMFTGKINPSFYLQQQANISRENVLKEREDTLKEREKALEKQQQQYGIETSNKEKEFNFQRREIDLQKKELEWYKRELDIQRKELEIDRKELVNQVNQGIEKEKLQSWIEGVKEGVRLKIQE